MQQFLSLWSALEPRKRIMIGIATIVMFAAVMFLAQVGGKNSRVLLYSNLESSSAGEVIAKLEQSGIDYEVRGNAIFVDPLLRDSLRMTLASEGLPSAAGAGYELLDSLSGFGTTSQMFDAAYWRAKEGELARTIVTNPQIKNARVHISNSTSSPFQRKFSTKASVTVSTGANALSASKIKAMKYLIASAVAGLDIKDVAIIDTQRGLISSHDETFTNSNSDLVSTLRKRVERILEARVGMGNAVVELSVETVTESESMTERVFDPSTRVIISTDTEERSTQSDDTRGVGGVSVASNLPEGDAGSDSKSSSQNTETRERVNYEVSETKREIIKVPGAIKRLTVAVLVNGSMISQADGSKQYEPRSDAEISELRELVAAAVGFQEDRGDLITVKTMEFEPLSELGTEPGSLESLSQPLNIMSLIQLGVLAGVVIVLGLFVVRPVLAGRPSIVMADLPAPASTSDTATESTPPLPDLPDLTATSSLPSLTGEIDTGDFNSPDFALPELDTPFPDFAVANNMGGFESSSDSPVDRLKQLIEDRQDETLEILRGWMEEKEENV